MKKYEEIKKLIGNSERITKAIDEWNGKYKNDSRCDKKGFNFNRDGRFSACDGLTISVDSWVGFYGDSGCSSILYLDKDIFNKHLLRVLQSEFFTIMEKVSDSIDAEAKTLKDEAKKELSERLEQIEKL